jgi:nitroreductase
MELLEGIRSRKSIRAFRSEAVPDKVIIDVLETAIRAPSGVNAQPWEFLVVRGTVLEEFRKANVEEYRLGRQPAPEVPRNPQGGPPPVLEGVFRERYIALGKQMFTLLGIPKGDKKRQSEHVENMYGFYGASVVIVIVSDKKLVGGWPILDIGFVTQNITLAAQAHGLGTCVMRAIVDYPDQARRALRIPVSKRIIVGIAVGYPDWDHPINLLRTDREKIENVVRFVE